MRLSVVSLVVLSAAASASYAQQKSAAPEKGAAPALGSPDSLASGLPGVYGPPSSASGQLRGVYGPSRTPAAARLPSRLSGSANSSRDNAPSVSIPGEVKEGQQLPEGVQPIPMSDRPGYGHARVNGRLALIDLNGNRIVQFLDSPGLLGGIAGPAAGLLPRVYGPAQAPSLAPTPGGSSPFSPTLTGSSSSITNTNLFTPGYALPTGAVTSPAPYGASGYGQAFVNGRVLLYDRSSNRIIEILR